MSASVCLYGTGRHLELVFSGSKLTKSRCFARRYRSRHRFVVELVELGDEIDALEGGAEEEKEILEP